MLKKVVVVGAGTMGNGIAHVFGLHQYDVVLVDISADQVDKAMTTISRNLDRMLKKGQINSDQKIETLLSIKTSTDLAMAVSDADLVIEAVSENLDLKHKIFKSISKHAPSDCILASNTSSISITKIASVTDHPERVIGMHFMNPVPVMKLIEIIKGHKTSPLVTKEVVSISNSLGKIPVEVNDYPGFIANRILMPMINEAIWSLHEGVGTVEAIDSIMKLGMAHPMGPLQLADFIGLDVCVSILKVMQDGFGNPKYAPCPLLINMVNAGLLGRKTREGFYKYD